MDNSAQQESGTTGMAARQMIMSTNWRQALQNMRSQSTQGSLSGLENDSTAAQALGAFGSGATAAYPTARTFR